MSAGHSADLPATLHRLRSALGAIVAHVELLQMDGVDARHLQQSTDEALRQLSVAEALSATLSRQDRVQVVLLEDDDLLGCALARRLRREGFSVCVTLDPASATSWTASDGVLVADLSALEDATQVEIDLIRRHRPVILTGASSAFAADAQRRFDAYAVLTKPVKTPDLVASVRAHPASGAT